MRRILILGLLLLLSICAFAQLEVKSGSFKEVPGFVNINPDDNYQTDDNDLPFAVIKVRTENINDKQRRELQFESNLATGILLEYKTGEVWVYVTAKYADYLKISHPDFSSVEFTLPYDLEPKKGYEMTLVNKPAIDADILKRLERLEELEKAGTAAIEVTSDNKEAKFLMGKFSVSPDKQVYISSGNLQYQASTKTWRFAENQYDIIGEDNMKCAPDYSGWIDLFKWGTSGYDGKNPYNKSNKIKDYVVGERDIANSNYDWGVYNKISNGGENSWRTLTVDEWTYLLHSRTTSSGDACVYYGIVNDIKGCIILPDDWNVSYGLTAPGAFNLGYKNNTISIHDWINIFEKNGAVFLPDTGLKQKNSYMPFSWGYWSSTHRGKTHAYMSSGKGVWALRVTSLPVRLVSDVVEQ